MIFHGLHVPAKADSHVPPDAAVEVQTQLMAGFLLYNRLFTLPAAISKHIANPEIYYRSLWVESLMVSAATQVSLLRRHGSHSPGQLFSLSLVEAEDGWSRFPLSKAGQLIQQWWLPCNFWMAQSPCSLLDVNNFQFRHIVRCI